MTSTNFRLTPLRLMNLAHISMLSCSKRPCQNRSRVDPCCDAESAKLPEAEYNSSRILDPRSLSSALTKNTSYTSDTNSRPYHKIVRLKLKLDDRFYFNLYKSLRLSQMKSKNLLFMATLVIVLTTVSSFDLWSWLGRSSQADDATGEFMRTQGCRQR